MLIILQCLLSTVPTKDQPNDGNYIYVRDNRKNIEKLIHCNEENRIKLNQEFISPFKFSKLTIRDMEGKFYTLRIQHYIKNIIGVGIYTTYRRRRIV